METAVSKRIAKLKPVQGELLFCRHPVGSRSSSIEPARIDFEREIGPYFPFTLNEKLECTWRLRSSCARRSFHCLVFTGQSLGRHH